MLPELLRVTDEMIEEEGMVGRLLAAKSDTQLNHGGHIALRKLRGLVVVLGVIVSLSAASAPTDAGAYTCGHDGGNCGHGCYDGGHYDQGCYDGGGYSRRCYRGNRYGRRFDDCGCGRDYGGNGRNYDGYGRSDGDGEYSSDYCRSCVSPWCRRYYRCE